MDLEKTIPMDRVLCGDVGFGKTEIAVRASFKVIESGRQVAILVPTTVLAEQHLFTFSERFSFQKQKCTFPRLQTSTTCARYLV